MPVLKRKPRGFTLIELVIGRDRDYRDFDCPVIARRSASP